MTITATGTACTIKGKSSTLSIAIGSTGHPEGTYTINDRALPGPGEYEVGEMFAELSPALAHFHLEDMVLVVRQDDGSPLGTADFEQLERADILLLVHAGGDMEPMLDALKLSAKIEPKAIVIVAADAAQIEAQVSGRSPETVETLKLTAKELPEEGQRLFILPIR